MDEKIYRQKNLDQLNSPEQLNNYIRVTSPGVWAVLVVLILLCIGALAWGTMGRIGGASLEDVVVISTGNEVQGFVRGSEGSKISGKHSLSVKFFHIGSKESLGDMKNGRLEWTILNDLDESTREILMSLGYGQETSVGVFDCPSVSLRKGIYVANIEEQGITPKSMIM